MSLPEKNLPLVSNDANERQLTSVEDSDPGANSSKIIIRKKSTRRKSYISLLLERFEVGALCIMSLFLVCRYIFSYNDFVFTTSQGK